MIEDDLKIVNVDSMPRSMDTDAWCHVVAGHNSSSTVYIENIPQGCDLSSHLPDTLDVPVYNIELSDDKLSATIELVNATGQNKSQKKLFMNPSFVFYYIYYIPACTQQFLYCNTHSVKNSHDNDLHAAKAQAHDQLNNIVLNV